MTFEFYSSGATFSLIREEEEEFFSIIWLIDVWIWLILDLFILEKMLH